MQESQSRSLQRPSSLHVDLARRIMALAVEQGWRAGRHLGETEIAATFEVSRTPVRSALQLLLRQGVVEARVNQGFFLLSDAGAESGHRHELPIARDEDISRAILRDHAAGRLPENLIESDLLQMYGVGRSALGKILLRLAEDGLIKRRRGHGWSFVPSLATPEARMESYRFRLMVECMGLCEPTFRLNKAQFKQCRTEHEAFLADIDGLQSPERFFEINSGLHAMLAACSGNRFVLQAVEAQNALRRLSEFAGYGDLDRAVVTRSCMEHLAILDALEAGENAWAANIMREHLSRGAGLAGQSLISIG